MKTIKNIFKEEFYKYISNPLRISASLNISLLAYIIVEGL